MATTADPQIPRAALIAAGLTMLGSLALVGTVQWAKFHPSSGIVRLAAPAPVMARALRFVDLQDGLNAFGGGVRVFDAAGGGEYAPLRQNDGFVRSALNALSYERHKAGLEGALRARLCLYAGGRMTLEDAESGAVIVLNDFGAGNRAVFERFLQPPPVARQREAGS